jgi:hypothetical protein
MAAFKAWVDELSPGVPPKSALGKAIGYCFISDKLNRFIEHPDVPPDNNRVEMRSDRSPGRRSWLFSDTQTGASEREPVLTGERVAPTASNRSLLTICTRIYPTRRPSSSSKLLPWNVKTLLKRSCLPSRNTTLDPAPVRGSLSASRNAIAAPPGYDCEYVFA